MLKLSSLVEGITLLSKYDSLSFVHRQESSEISI